jgi:hypothetical protein
MDASWGLIWTGFLSLSGIYPKLLQEELPRRRLFLQRSKCNSGYRVCPCPLWSCERTSISDEWMNYSPEDYLLTLSKLQLIYENCYELVLQMMYLTPVFIERIKHCTVSMMSQCIICGWFFLPEWWNLLVSRVSSWSYRLTLRINKFS